MAEAKDKSTENAQKEVPVQAAGAQPAAAPASGARTAFKDLSLQLTKEELANSGTQKCILDMLLRAEQQCDKLESYVSKYHDSDNRVGVLEEQSKTNSYNETLFAVGITVGGTIMGLAPFLFEKGYAYGGISLGIGVALMAGATVARIKFK